MKGYYNNPGATREALEDGWLYTGDLGYIDADGFLHIQGRKKSVIVTPGGKNIYPEEIEAEILKSPLISECLVWGDATEDPGRDSVITAVVVPDLEQIEALGLGKAKDVDEKRFEEIIRKEVKEKCRQLAAFKRVTRVSVRWEEFEKTTTKKIKRYLYTRAGSQPAASGRGQ
jgi:long-chain acyl-CoA synthetase